jgi:putative hydrolase of the HAD superfamily
LNGAGRTVDTVLFDLDDTLHDDSDAFKRAAERVAGDVGRALGIDAARLPRTYIAVANGYWQRLSVAELAQGIHDARVELWYEALTAIGVRDRALAQRCSDSYTEYRAELLALYPGAREVLIALRERGCRLGIVTNGFAATHNRKIDVLGLRPLIDALFLADEMGMVKPDPGVFVHACRTLGSEVSRTAMVGDRYDRDVIGAQSLGLFTVLIDVHAIPLPEGAVPPDATVDSIAEVLDVLPLAAAQGGLSRPTKRPA